jgi:hypothetical protein
MVDENTGTADLVLDKCCGGVQVLGIPLNLFVIGTTSVGAFIQFLSYMKTILECGVGKNGSTVAVCGAYYAGICNSCIKSAGHIGAVSGHATIPVRLVASDDLFQNGHNTLCRQHSRVLHMVRFRLVEDCQSINCELATFDQEACACRLRT